VVHFLGTVAGAHFLYLPEHGLYMIPVEQTREDAISAVVDSLDAADVPIDLSALVVSFAGLADRDQTSVDLRELRTRTPSADDCYVREIIALHELQREKAALRAEAKEAAVLSFAERMYRKSLLFEASLVEEIVRAEASLERVRGEMAGEAKRAELAKAKRLERLGERTLMLPVNLAKARARYESVKTELALQRARATSAEKKRRRAEKKRRRAEDEESGKKNGKKNRVTEG
jgi:hypothetical protein